MARWRIAGVNFDHMHMGDLLRQVHEHPEAELVGICDEQPERMNDAVEKFGIADDDVFTSYRKCLEKTRPDLVILCPATGEHGRWTQKVAPFGVHILMEKPFAATLADADAMIEAVKATGKQLAINWPLAWYSCHRTTKRLIDEGIIGKVLEVHYYDGNRGPVRPKAGKEQVSEAEALQAKQASWWYKKDAGGGSLLDYLGYGTTLGTWFMDGRSPIDVTCTTRTPPGLEVDEHSITVARYATGLSKFETRWGTFTDPWTHQPQPKCGFVVVGSAGTISSYDYEETIRVQTHDCPEGRTVSVDGLEPPFQNPIQYVLDRLGRNEPVQGPLSPAMSRIGQQIVETAYRSAREGRTIPLIA